MTPWLRRLTFGLASFVVAGGVCSEGAYRFALSKVPSLPPISTRPSSPRVEALVRAHGTWSEARSFPLGEAERIALIGLRGQRAPGTSLQLEVARRRFRPAMLPQSEFTLASMGLAEWLRRHASESELTWLWSDLAMPRSDMVGLEAGARLYFERPLDRLHSHELAALLALADVPVLPRRPERWLQRRNWIIEGWRG